MKRQFYPCACCGFLTMSFPSGSGATDFCEVCGWQDDAVQFHDPDFRGGANKESLHEARENYKKFGASNQQRLGRVRPPLPEEIQPKQ